MYSDIQSAVSAAAAGDTIYVFANTGATAASPTTFSGGANIRQNLTIIGVGAVAIAGNGFGSVLVINNGPTVTLVNLTITSGNGRLRGGINTYNGATTTLIGVTVANNTVQGGNGGGINNSGILTLVHSTVAGNSAPVLPGGGIYNSGTATLTNSLVAGNSATTGPDLDGNAPTSTNSVIGGVTPNATTGLGTLGDHGGPTQTVDIATTSPAYNNAACATNPTTNATVATDQRDLARPQSTTCDAGAFELGAGTPAASPPPFPPTITTLALPVAPLNRMYNQPLVTTNGAGPYAYSLLTGTLPTGVTLTGGAITGTPTVSGAFPIVVGVTDAGQFANIRALTLYVAPPSATYTVGSIADDDLSTNPPAATQADCTNPANTNCTLRDALFYAVSGSDTIVFKAGLTGPIMLMHGTLTLTASATITGPGAAALAVDGGGVARVFTVNTGLTVAISGLTVQGGNAGGGGGLFLTGGSVTLTGMIFTGNTATANGGAIDNFGGALTISGSTFVNNQAQTNNGGAIDSDFSGATLTITNSTFLGNTTSFLGNTTSSVSTGGAINVYQSTAMLTNVTLVDNGPNNAVSSFANGGTPAAVTLTNVLVANHGSAPDLEAVNGGTFSGSNNLTDDGTGSLITGGTGNLTNMPALVSTTLGTYGSANGTETLPLLPGSPAIDAGAAVEIGGPPGARVPAKDQRGITRPQGRGVDIGAFESQGFTLTAGLGTTPQSAPVTTAFPTALAAIVTANNPVEPVAGGIITFTVAPVGGAQATFGTLAGCTLTNGNLTAACPIIGTTATAPPLTANATVGGYSATASARGAAAPANFTLTNTPLLTSLSPSSLGAGHAAFTLTVTGSGFAAGDVVQWNGAARPTTFVSATTLTAMIPASDVATPGTASVTVAAPGPLLSNALVFTITAAPVIAVSPASLPDGVKGVAYPPQALTASGGTAPYTFAVTAGSLPPGLTLAATGTLTGTPTAAGGPITFTVTATDANGYMGSQAYTVTITPAGVVSVTISPAATTPLKVGQSGRYTITVTYQDGTTMTVPPGQWTVDNPGVLGLDAGTGTLTARSPGTAAVSVTVNGTVYRFAFSVAAPTPVGITVPTGRPGGATAGTAGAPAPTPLPAPSAPRSGAGTGASGPPPLPIGR